MKHIQMQKLIMVSMPHGLRSNMSKIREILSKWEGKYYRKKVQNMAKVCGPNLYCGGKSFVTANTELGTNVNFNGMEES